MFLQLAVCSALLLVGASSSNLIGGASYAKKVHPDVLKTAKDGVETFYKEERNVVPEGVFFISGTSQVVAGISWKLHIGVSLPDNKVDICSINLWQRQWLSKKFQIQAYDDNGIKCDLADRVAKTIERFVNDRSNNLYYAKVGSDITFTRTNQRLRYEVNDVDLYVSECSNDDGNKDNCKPDKEKKPLIRCSAVTEWSKTALNFDTKVTCVNPNAEEVEVEEDN